MSPAERGKQLARALLNKLITGPACPTCPACQGPAIPGPVLPGSACLGQGCPGPACPGPTGTSPACPGPACPGPACPGPDCHGPDCHGPARIGLTYQEEDPQAIRISRHPAMAMQQQSYIYSSTFCFLIAMLRKVEEF